MSNKTRVFDHARGLSLALAVCLIAACSGDDGDTETTETTATTTTTVGPMTGTSSTTSATSTGAGPTGGTDTGSGTTMMVETTGEPELCGNGELDGDEVCDDGVNDGGYDGCAPGCDALGPYCGDGEQNGAEACDDGNDVDTDDCLVSCELASCGDGFVQEGVEACDDGVNDDAYEGCAMDCLALGPFCGDGLTNGPEECDDGNDVEDDGCDNACISDFTSATFSNCGQTGHTGPSQAQCDAAYSGDNPLDGAVTVMEGLQYWDVPSTATYRIEVWGAEGGVHNAGTGGRGARVRGDFALTAGQTLKILVGQMGSDGTLYDVGGGGGTYVVQDDDTPLIVAGGGGASGNCGGYNLTTQDGKGATGNGRV